MRTNDNVEYKVIWAVLRRMVIQETFQERVVALWMEKEEEAAWGTERCRHSIFSQWDNRREHRETVNRVSPV